MCSISSDSTHTHKEPGLHKVGLLVFISKADDMVAKKLLSAFS